MKLTQRQKILLGIVLGGVARGSWLDIDELIAALAAAGEPVGSKQSIQCSIRFLEAKALLARSYGLRRGRRRMVLTPTAEAMRLAA